MRAYLTTDGADRGHESPASRRRAGVQFRSQGDALGQAEAEEGRMKETAN